MVLEADGDGLNKFINDLLISNCEVPFKELASKAEEKGYRAGDILNVAESSSNCQIDWLAGVIRCTEKDEPLFGWDDPDGDYYEDDENEGELAGAL